MDRKRLISKIGLVYELLHKIPLDVDFYEKYHEYKLLAVEIESLMNIDKERSAEDNSIESFMSDTLYGYVHFKIFPLLNFIEKNKETLFLEFPEDALFKEVTYNFLKLGKMEGDERYDYWLSKTDDTFNVFLDNIKTTEKGNNFFVKTNIMNSVPEIDVLYKHIQKDKKSQKSYLERIDENDTYGLIEKIKELEVDETLDFSISLTNRGKTDYIGFYDRNELTKEEMLEPVNLFQNLIKLNDIEQATEKEDSVLFDSESSKLICKGNEIKLTKGKDIYYIIKYIFEREDVYDECFYDEIRDNSELNDGKPRTDKNMYDALMQFNKRLINKGISDLFIINFHSIKIRNGYKVVTL